MGRMDTDKQLDHMLGIGDTTDAIIDLANDIDKKIHETLKAYGRDIPTLSFFGCTIFQLREARKIGEARGKAIERSMIAGLFREGE